MKDFNVFRLPYLYSIMAGEAAPPNMITSMKLLHILNNTEVRY